MADANPRNALLEDVNKALAKHQPELNASLASDCIRVSGTFVCSGPLGEFDRFEIECAIPWTYPAKEPAVWETGGRIERTVPNHVYPTSGRCCLGHWDLWRLRNLDSSVEAFFRDHVHSYFVGQSLNAQGEGWFFGEEGHSKAEIAESYLEAFELPEGSDRRVFVQLICAPHMGANPKCPCGSDRFFKVCHREFVKEIRRTIPADLRKSVRKKISGSLQPKEDG